ncbi:hypothetical protein OC65_01205 [Salmonella enterica]|nr:hypothetical protein [Salmonella enterica]
MPIFTPAAHAIVVKRLMHSIDKIHHIIDSKMNGQAGIMSLFWKQTYENRRPSGYSACDVAQASRVSCVAPGG